MTYDMNSKLFNPEDGWILFKKKSYSCLDDESSFLNQLKPHTNAISVEPSVYRFVR